jgi:uncharacterized membrane protein YcaP (DUF421 family)
MEGSELVAGWLEIVFRALGAIAALFLLTRILGKKQISQLTFFEYITSITIGDLAGFISTDVETNYLYGLIAIFTWFLIPYIVEWLTMKSRRMRVWFEGKEDHGDQGWQSFRRQFEKGTVHRGRTAGAIAI